MPLETILGELEQVRTTSLSDYNDLVDQFVYGTHDPLLSDVVRILNAAGKTDAELSKAVSDAKKRNELRNKIAAADAGRIEKAALLEQIEAADAALEAAKRARDETVRPLVVRIGEIDGLAMEAMSAKRELIERCADEELLARGHSNRIAIDRLSASIRQQAELARRIRVNHDHLVASEGQAAPDTIAKRERLERETKKLAEMRVELDRLVAESNEIVEAKIHA